MYYKSVIIRRLVTKANAPKTLLPLKLLQHGPEHLPHLGRCLQGESEGGHAVALTGLIEGGGGDAAALVTHQDAGGLGGGAYSVGIVHLVDERIPGAVVGQGGKAAATLRTHDAPDVPEIGHPLIAQHLPDEVPGALRSLGNALVNRVPGIRPDVGAGDEDMPAPAGKAAEGGLQARGENGVLVRHGAAPHAGGELLAADDIGRKSGSAAVKSLHRGGLEGIPGI